MDRTYFERLHRQEARDAEWHMLNEALQGPRKERTRTRITRKMRRAIGGWLISVGTWLAGTRAQVAPCTCLDDGTLNQECSC
jgi:hypothetical protein